MILIKCGSCSEVIQDRSKSIYSGLYDEFYCSPACEINEIVKKESGVPQIKLYGKGDSNQLRWDM